LCLRCWYTIMKTRNLPSAGTGVSKSFLAFSQGSSRGWLRLVLFWQVWSVVFWLSCWRVDLLCQRCGMSFHIASSTTQSHGRHVRSLTNKQLGAGWVSRPRIGSRGITASAHLEFLQVVYGTCRITRQQIWRSNSVYYLTWWGWGTIAIRE